MYRYHGSNLRRGRYSESGRIYLVTTVCIGRERLFESPVAATILIAELHRREREELCMNHCYVVMPDHVH